MQSPSELQQYELGETHGVSQALSHIQPVPVQHEVSPLQESRHWSHVLPLEPVTHCPA